MLGSRRHGRHAPAHARVARGGTTPADGRAGPVLVVDEPSAGPDENPAGPRSDVRADDTPAGPTPARGGRALLRGVVQRDRTLTVGGAHLRVLVLASTPEDTTVVDLSSRSLMRLRVPWPAGHAPDLSPFDVVEATLADDPECDDLAQPEAVTVASPPRRVGSLKGRRARTILERLSASHDGPLLGFHGPSAPYWDFRGLRPSIALVHPTRAPQLLRRQADGSTWVRFGWERDDVWLPVEDGRSVRALDASRSERLAGKQLSTALGFSPHYLLVAVSSPRSGHCYKICSAILPRG